MLNYNYKCYYIIINKNILNISYYIKYLVLYLKQEILYKIKIICDNHNEQQSKKISNKSTTERESSFSSYFLVSYNKLCLLKIIIY